MTLQMKLKKTTGEYCDHKNKFTKYLKKQQKKHLDYFYNCDVNYDIKAFKFIYFKIK